MLNKYNFISTEDLDVENLQIRNNLKAENIVANSIINSSSELNNGIIKFKGILDVKGENNSIKEVDNVNIKNSTLEFSNTSGSSTISTFTNSNITNGTVEFKHDTTIIGNNSTINNINNSDIINTNHQMTFTSSGQSTISKINNGNINNGLINNQSTFIITDPSTLINISNADINNQSTINLNGGTVSNLNNSSITGNQSTNKITVPSGKTVSATSGSNIDLNNATINNIGTMSLSDISVTAIQNSKIGGNLTLNGNTTIPSASVMNTNELDHAIITNQGTINFYSDQTFKKIENSKIQGGTIDMNNHNIGVEESGTFTVGDIDGTILKNAIIDKNADLTVNNINNGNLDGGELNLNGHTLIVLDSINYNEIKNSNLYNGDIVLQTSGLNVGHDLVDISIGKSGVGAPLTYLNLNNTTFNLGTLSTVQNITNTSLIGGTLNVGNNNLTVSGTSSIVDYTGGTITGTGSINTGNMECVSVRSNNIKSNDGIINLISYDNSNNKISVGDINKSLYLNNSTITTTSSKDTFKTDNINCNNIKSNDGTINLISYNNSNNKISIGEINKKIEFTGNQLIYNNTSLITSNNKDIFKTDILEIDQLKVNEIKEINGGIFATNIKVGYQYMAQLPTGTYGDTITINNNTLKVKKINSNYFVLISLSEIDDSIINNHKIIYQKPESSYITINDITEIVGQKLYILYNNYIELDDEIINTEINDEGNITTNTITTKENNYSLITSENEHQISKVSIGNNNFKLLRFDETTNTLTIGDEEFNGNPLNINIIGFKAGLSRDFIARPLIYIKECYFKRIEDIPELININYLNIEVIESGTPYNGIKYTNYEDYEQLYNTFEMIYYNNKCVININDKSFVDLNCNCPFILFNYYFKCYDDELYYSANGFNWFKFDITYYNNYKKPSDPDFTTKDLYKIINGLPVCQCKILNKIYNLVNPDLYVYLCIPWINPNDNTDKGYFCFTCYTQDELNMRY